MGFKMKKRIIIDLDVVTIGLWKKNDKRKPFALNFMKRVNNKEFLVVMLTSTLNLVEKWNNVELSTNIRDYYSKNTDHFIDDLEIFNFLRKYNISVSEIIKEFLKKGIKREDIMLILACITVKADYLVTLNRKHLKGNNQFINEILKKNKLHTIKVVYPNEI